MSHEVLPDALSGKRKLSASAVEPAADENRGESPRGWAAPSPRRKKKTTPLKRAGRTKKTTSTSTAGPVGGSQRKVGKRENRKRGQRTRSVVVRCRADARAILKAIPIEDPDEPSLRRFGLLIDEWDQHESGAERAPNREWWFADLAFWQQVEFACDEVQFSVLDMGDCDL